jgi:hypothetical protein
VTLRTVVGLTAAIAASLVGTAGLVAGQAGAVPGQTIPASELTDTIGVPVPIFASPFTDPTVTPGPPNVKMTGNCEAASWLFAPNTTANPHLPTLWLNFTSGNAVVYRQTSNPVFPQLPGGLNAVGNAELWILTAVSSTGVPTFAPTGFAGPTHAWLGQNANAQGQFYAGETVSFTGTDGLGSTISFTANPGFVGKAHSAPGVPSSGWGQQNLSCNIATG